MKQFQVLLGLKSIYGFDFEKSGFNKKLVHPLLYVAMNFKISTVTLRKVLFELLTHEINKKCLRIDFKVIVMFHWPLSLIKINYK